MTSKIRDIVVLNNLKVLGMEGEPKNRLNNIDLNQNDLEKVRNNIKVAKNFLIFFHRNKQN